MAIVNVNLTLYKAKALINIKYDHHIIKEGQTVELRYDDAVDLSERNIVEMIDNLSTNAIDDGATNKEAVEENGTENNVAESTSTIKAEDENKSPENAGGTEGGK